MNYFRTNIARTAATVFLITFISVFLYSEAGFAFSEKEASESNDYCLIVKGADLSLTKTKEYTPLKIKTEIAIYIFHCNEKVSQNLYYIVQSENNHSPSKTSKVYLHDCSFLI